jgi:hypothetical protein
MAPIETQQLPMLEHLRQAGTQPMTLDQLRAGGIDFPAVVIGEFELNGYVIERVPEQGKLLGVRLLETEAPDPPTTRRAPPMAPPTVAIATRAHRRRSVWNDGRMAARRCRLGPAATSIEERTRGPPIWPSTRRSASDASRGPWKSPGASARKRKAQRTLAAVPFSRGLGLGPRHGARAQCPGQRRPSARSRIPRSIFSVIRKLTGCTGSTTSPAQRRVYR